MGKQFQLSAIDGVPSPRSQPPPNYNPLKSDTDRGVSKTDAKALKTLPKNPRIKRLRLDRDRVTIPKEPLHLVRQDVFDEEEATKNEYRNSQSSPERARVRWASLNAGNGHVRVRYRRADSSSGKHLHQTRTRYDCDSSSAWSERNLLCNSRRRDNGQVPCSQSVQFEDEDISELIDDSTRQARRVEANERIKKRRSEPDSARGLDHGKHSEYKNQPNEFMIRMRARSENYRAKDKYLERMRKTASGAGPSLDGLLIWQSFTNAASCTLESTLNEYVEAFKLWPPTVIWRVQEETKISPQPGDKRKGSVTTDCSQISKKPRLDSNSEDLDDNAQAAECAALCMSHTHICQILQYLQSSSGNIFDGKIDPEDPNRVGDERPDKEFVRCGEGQSDVGRQDSGYESHEDKPAIKEIGKVGDIQRL